jgi:hypothetical protein
VPEEVDLGDRFAYYAKRARQLSLRQEENGFFLSRPHGTKYIVTPEVLSVWASQKALFLRLDHLGTSTAYLSRSVTRCNILLGFLPSSLMSTFSVTVDHLRVEEELSVLERNRAAVVASCARTFYKSLHGGRRTQE